MRKLTFFFFTIYIAALQICAQEQDTIKIKALRYFTTEFGFGHGSYRDVGVSPLIYSGVMPSLAIGHKATKPHFIWETKASVHYAMYSRSTGDAIYRTNAYGFHFQSDFYRKTSAEMNNLSFYVGTGTSYDMSARVSPHYMNAGFVLNNFIHLHLNGKLALSFMAKPVDKRLMFINIKRPERKYSLALNLNIPFASIYQHPGYSYVSHGTTNENNEFSDYRWHVLIFSGITGRIELLRHLDNGNALGIAYNLHIFSSKSNLRNYLQMADQSVSLSMFLKL